MDDRAYSDDEQKRSTSSVLGYKELLMVQAVDEDGDRCLRKIGVMWEGGEPEALRASATHYAEYRQWVDLALLSSSRLFPKKSLGPPVRIARLPADADVSISITGPDSVLRSRPDRWPQESPTTADPPRYTIPGIEPRPMSEVLLAMGLSRESHPEQQPPPV
jgi:hypothetical protein